MKLVNRLNQVKGQYRNEIFHDDIIYQNADVVAIVRTYPDDFIIAPSCAGNANIISGFTARSFRQQRLQ